MSVRRSQNVELVVSGMALGGKGLARVEGMAVFVDQAIPGDVVEARVVRRKKRFAEARVVRMISPSPLRVEAPCPYAGICGGCKWQCLPYGKQLEYKREHVVEALEHIGGLHDVPVHPVKPSERSLGYRNKMEFSCTQSRWLLPDEMGQDNVEAGFGLGLHVAGTYNKVLDVQACLLQPDLGNHILRDVKAFMKESGLPAYGLKSHEGFWRFCMLRHSCAHDRWMVNLITSEKRTDRLVPLAQRLRDAYPEVASVVNNITARKAAVAVGEQEFLVAGDPYLHEGIGRFEFTVSSNSFFQTNTLGAERLYRTVVQYAGCSGRERVVDLYSGTGAIAILLAERASEVLGMEINEGAVKDARSNCERNGVNNCRFVAGDIRMELAAGGAQADIVIVDPPRSGMHPKVTEQLVRLAAPKLVYVSCNPATLARDLSLLAEAYQVLEVQPVDMFPHTAHIESVARLERR